MWRVNMLLDVLIPYFGDSKFLEKYIIDTLSNKSVIDKIRFILIDNASDEKIDDSFIKKYTNNVIYHRNDLNIGRVGNWNRALEYIESDWYCFLFLGDMLINLEKLIEELETAAEFNIVSFNMQMNNSGKRTKIGKYIFHNKGVYSGQKLINAYLPIGLMPWGPLQTNVFRKPLCSLFNFDVNDTYHADVGYILNNFSISKVKIINSIHLEWLVEPNRTHFKIQLFEFLLKDFVFIGNYLKISGISVFKLKTCLCARALVMSKHYGFKAFTTTIKKIFAA